MASGRINLQSNDGKVAGVVFEDGASSNVTVTVPKEGGNVVTDKDATITSNLNMVGTGLRITGDFSNAIHSNRVAFQSSTLNGATSPFFIPNGTGTIGQVVAGSSSDASNTSYISILANATTGVTSINSDATGTGTRLPMVFTTGGLGRMRIDTAGNVLVTGSGGLGYGTGSGGTVTQLTSKSTAVTLNKPYGQITMNNSPLGAGVSVSFYLNNSLLTYADLVIVNPIANNSYTVQVFNTSAGSVGIRVTNMSAGSLSEALVINFAIIKGATA